MTLQEEGVHYGTGGIETMKRVLTVNDAAEYIGVSTRTLRRLLAARRIRYLKIGSLVRIYQPDLDNFMEESVIEAAQLRTDPAVEITN